jgi:hypothetical protein
MLTQKQFEKYMNFFIDRNTKFEKAEKILQDLSTEPDFVSITGLAQPALDIYLDLITDAMGLQDHDLLSWWVFETDCGKDKGMAKIYKQLKSGKEKVIAELTDLDKLYKYIVKEVKLNGTKN